MAGCFDDCQYSFRCGGPGNIYIQPSQIALNSVAKLHFGCFGILFDDWSDATAKSVISTFWKNLYLPIILYRRHIRFLYGIQSLAGRGIAPRGDNQTHRGKVCGEETDGIVQKVHVLRSCSSRYQWHDRNSFTAMNRIVKILFLTFFG